MKKFYEEKQKYDKKFNEELEKTGIFWAFSVKQFEVVEPKLKEEFVSNIDINDLIKYELGNHECYYTGDYYCIIPIIANYLKNYNYEEVSSIVKKVYFEEAKKYNGR